MNSQKAIEIAKSGGKTLSLDGAYNVIRNRASIGSASLWLCGYNECPDVIRHLNEDGFKTKIDKKVDSYLVDIFISW